MGREDHVSGKVSSKCIPSQWEKTWHIYEIGWNLIWVECKVRRNLVKIRLRGSQVRGAFYFIIIFLLIPQSLAWLWQLHSEFSSYSSIITILIYMSFQQHCLVYGKSSRKCPGDISPHILWSAVPNRDQDKSFTFTSSSVQHPSAESFYFEMRYI